jgi:O-antigen/teichoic acid export membrane protein
VTDFPNQKRLVREFAVMAVGQAAALLAAIVTVKVLTLNLGQAEYGRLALGMTVPILLNQFLFGPLALGLMRYYSISVELNQQRDLTSVAARSTAVLATLVIVVGLPLCAIAGMRRGHLWGWLFAGMLVYGIVSSTQGFFGSVYAAARLRGLAAISQLVDPLVRLLCGVAAVLFVGRSAVAVAWTFAIGMLIATAVQWLVYWRSQLSLPESTPMARRALTRNLWHYSKYVIGFGGFSWMQVASDRWALDAFGGVAAVGIYAYAYQVASLPILVVGGAIAQFLNPIIFQRAGNLEDSAKRATAMRTTWIGVALLFALMICGSAAALLFGERIALLLGSEQFRKSGDYIWILVLGLGAVQMGHMIGMIPLTLKRLRGHSVVRIVVGLFAVAVNVFAARQFGLRGVVIASVVIGVFYCMLAAANAFRLLNGSADDSAASEPQVLSVTLQ